MAWRTEDFLVLLSPLLAAPACTRSPSGDGDDGGPSPEEICTDFGGHLVECAEQAFQVTMPDGYASYYATQCLDGLAAAPVEMDCQTLSEDYLACLSTVSCNAMFSGMACNVARTALLDAGCTDPIAPPPTASPDTCTQILGECVCTVGTFRCSADPTSTECCTPCDSGNDNHIVGGDQCVCNEGFTWCTEAIEDLSCCPV